MAMRESAETFLKKLPSFDKIILKEALKGFNQVTQNILSESQDRVPIARGILLESGAVLKAQQTPTGLKSSVLYKANYAKKIHDGKGPLIPKGQPSYYDGGQLWNKQRTGERQFLSSAMADHEDNLLEEVYQAIDLAWDRI